MSQIQKTSNPVVHSNNKRWTRKDEQILRQMARERASTAQIAIVLGRTKASVWSRKNSLGIVERLSSSKGTGISAPTTVSSKNRTGNSTEKVVKVKKVRQVKQNTPEIQSLDFASISALAKASGAKIVITFE